LSAAVGHLTALTERYWAYTGPVTTLQNQFIDITADNVNITATKPNNFIHTGSGNDAIDLSLFEGQGHSVLP